MAARKLDLVSFASNHRGDALSVALRNLGYELSLARWEKWLQERPNGFSKPTVLFIADGNYPHEEVVATLEETPRPQVLAVFSCNNASWNEDVFRCCVDFLGWPCRQNELDLRLRRAFGGAQPQIADPDETILMEEFFNLNMLGKAPAFVEALKLIKKFARCDAPVLLEGETGTGKEVAAHAVHYLSARRDEPFIPVNCGTIPDNLLENELFGHEKGAFTDAKESQPGLVMQANKGTLFLDEVDALSPAGQVALLRFIEEQRFRPLGGKNFTKVDVRVVAATNGDLQKLVENGTFRQDLLFRLNVLGVWLPPLRERGDDIALLAEAFLSRYSVQYNVPEKHLHPDTLSTLLSRDWPGNVRELENMMHRAFLLAEGPAVSVLQSNHRNNREISTHNCGQSLYFDLGFQEAKARIVSDFEKRYLCWVMSETGGNVSRAAECAGKERSALSKLLKKHNIRRKQYDS